MSLFRDEMLFLQKFPDLLQATTDEDEPTPSYLYNRITAITLNSGGMYCTRVLEFLLNRIQYGSFRVQFKALKVCLHLLKDGHPDFRSELQRKYTVINDAGSLMDPFLTPLGNTTPAMVRAVKQEVLSELFNENAGIEQRDPAMKQNQFAVPLGYGSQSASTTSKLPGFGSVKFSGGDSVVDNLSQMVNKILMPPQVVDRRSDIAEHLPQYQPASLDTKTIATENTFQAGEQQYPQPHSMPPTASIPAKKLPMYRSHKPGKAGGGWDEGDTFSTGNGLTHIMGVDANMGSNKSSISADSLEREEPIDPIDQEENKLVDEFTSGKEPFPPNWTSIADACKRCSTLNCDKVVELLGHKLVSDKESSILRALVLLEAMLHRDLAMLEVFTKNIYPNLELLQSCTEEIIRFKAKKLYLSVQKLSSIQKQHNHDSS